jgi:tetratricopeptide (TPR) repeat protein
LELIMSFESLRPTARRLRTPLAERALELLKYLPGTSREKTRTLYLKGLAYRVMYRYREAIPYLQSVVQSEPENLAVWLDLGWCYKRCGRLDLAIESLEHALQTDDEQAIVHYNLACYWSLAGNTQLAIQYLARALELDGEFRELIAQEPDFDPIRDFPDFQAVAGVIV